MLEIILSSGEAIAGRRKQKEMKTAGAYDFILRFWPNYQELATAVSLAAAISGATGR
jgi:hypothetical protein